MSDFLKLRREASQYWPAVVIDQYFPFFSSGNPIRLLISAGALILSLTSLALYFFEKVSFVENGLGSFASKTLSDLGRWPGIIYGIFFIVIALELGIRALGAFYASHAFLDIVDISEDENFRRPACSYEAAYFLLMPEDADPILNLAITPAGGTALYRLGLNPVEVKKFSKDRVNKIKSSDLVLTDNLSNPLNLAKIASEMLSFDKELSVFMASRKITKEDFIGAISWAEYLHVLKRRGARWWGRERLGRIPGFGKQWSFGETPTLSRYAVEIYDSPFYRDAEQVLSVRKNEVNELENILSRTRGANALVVADSEEEALRVIGALGVMIKSGEAMPALEHKQIYVLDYATMISTTKQKNIFENKLTSALNEASRAGNIILAIKDLPAFIAGATQIGSDIQEIMNWYLASPAVHIIATASNETFHSVIENNPSLMRYFEKILIKGIGGQAVMKYLMEEAIRIERESGVWFLFQALREAAESAERFFFGGDMEDKSADLLIEAATSARNTGATVIGREDIMRLVEAKTGIPRQISSEKTDNKILLELEKILSKRIIGQEEGVKAISSAMRRAHAGITNPNRPTGSFLFLGPTGVGKTETTRALADAFFGGESAILRLDMSEYNTPDALDRLIGDFSIGKPGVLSSMLRDKPYGVLLLDEFEKTSVKVHDLFMQIIDEGIFSDAGGKKVNARNLIIIATSNAGSDKIWQIVKERGQEALNKDEVVSEVINRGIFKPELLNRFDGVIVFHPLDRMSLVKIAELMLKKLNRRLAEKGLEISVTPELVNALVEKGTDPTFGARPMNRAIQDKVETMLADKILRGEAPAGTRVVFSTEEIEGIRN